MGLYCKFAVKHLDILDPQHCQAIVNEDKRVFHTCSRLKALLNSYYRLSCSFEVLVVNADILNNNL